MSFIDEISKIFSGGENFPQFKGTLLGDRCVYFEGVKDIKSFSNDKIEFRLKKGEISVQGEGLCIKKYCVGDLAISGKIKSVTIVESEKD